MKAISVESNFSWKQFQLIQEILKAGRAFSKNSPGHWEFNIFWTKLVWLSHSAAASRWCCRRSGRESVRRLCDDDGAFACSLSLPWEFPFCLLVLLHHHHYMVQCTLMRFVSSLLSQLSWFDWLCLFVRSRELMDQSHPNLGTDLGLDGHFILGLFYMLHLISNIFWGRWCIFWISNMQFPLIRI